MSFKKDFWNKKILSWEKNKYKKVSRGFDVNLSVKHRLHLASSVLSQMSEKTSLLELGCGSGLFWERIKTLNLKSYTGVDFSKTAIGAFQNKIQDFKNKDRISLFCEDCIEASHSSDIVISLGLFDWISMEKIKKISEKHKESWYLHSFSEKRLSLSQIAHSLYSFINYRCKDYSPLYRPADELLSIFGPNAKIYRDSRLSFGAFIYHLPNHIQFKC